MFLLEFILTALSVVLLVPAITLFVQVVAAFLGRNGVPLNDTPRPRIAVLVPAHDESAVVTQTLIPLRSQLLPGDRLLLVADNCTDDTAAIAAAEGAEVIERQDDRRRGKGFALDFGMRHMAADPPEIVVIVDADCRVEPGAVDGLARKAVATNRPVQGLYLMHADPSAGLKMQIAEFAWLINNHVRALGCLQLGWPCRLMGSGMAFPWSMLAESSLASGHIVEDLKLGIDLSVAGKSPLYFPRAEIHSDFPVAEAGVESQRTRWEHGFIATVVREVPALLRKGLVGRDAALLGLALDLCVPPLALLVLLIIVITAICMLVLPLGAGVVLLASSALFLIVAAVMLGWWRWGREVIALKTLLSVPFYILAKVPLYLRFFSKRQKDWVRTDRDT